MFRTAIVTLFAAFAAFPATADMKALGDIHIEGPMLRATPPNAPVAGGFVTIVNHGETDDTLVSASIEGPLAERVELHEMTMNEGVMTMSEVAGGIAIPAGETVILAPGGLHLMLMGLTEPLTAGDTHLVTLTFAEAGDVTIGFPVLTLGEIRAKAAEDATMDHSGEGHGDGGHMKHGN
ncbi:copper chaperone PCu(A)C [Jannaschia pohangensis]|uniref:Copper(I)-binding protein n=1 Tax=Jannaschia pohangensis TaxID=390807 RepID=A0A1I3S4L1_9RHOB|nr:copper chaperone PCu(A)C [Jannaschia pohangensis]SFJ53558.1 hypothetical protein SAMN04488095_3014 [Jannaschia pohangensis]